jgi:hypothetical protein
MLLDNPISVNTIDSLSDSCSSLTTYATTPPESLLCTKFGTIEHQDITDIPKDEFVWSQTIPSQLHDIWKIQVVVRDIRLGFRAYLIIENTIDSLSDSCSSLTTYAMLYESIKECSSSNPCHEN